MNPKPQVITVYIPKGGVAKSTLVWLLGLFLSGLGYHVVIIDMDRQGSQSKIFDLIDDTGRGGEVLHLVLKRRLDILAALTIVSDDLVPRFDGHTPGTLAVVQGGALTKEAIDEIAATPVRFKMASTLDIVRGPVAALAGQADFVLMDMGPSDQVSTIAGLVATDQLLIPVTMNYLDVMQIAPVLDEVEVSRQVNPDLAILGIVPTLTRYYFGGMRKSKGLQTGERFLNEAYSEMILKDPRGVMVDFPYNEDIPKVMWAGGAPFGDDTSRNTRLELLRLLNTIAARINLEEEVTHV